MMGYMFAKKKRITIMDDEYFDDFELDESLFEDDKELIREILRDLDIDIEEI